MAVSDRAITNSEAVARHKANCTAYECGLCVMIDEHYRLIADAESGMAIAAKTTALRRIAAMPHSDDCICHEAVNYPKPWECICHVAVAADALGVPWDKAD